MSIREFARPDARLHLAGFFAFGPAYVWAEAERPEIYYEFDGFAQLARTAERGLFTALFLGDSQRLREHLGKINDTVVTGRPDQLVLFAYLAAITERIGLVATLNTTYTEPVDLARRLASIDALSSGRAGWNVVTTDNAWTGANFRKGGYLANTDRYRQAAEYLQVVQSLWDASADPQFGIAPGTARLEHHGAFYDLSAHPSVPASPQTHPVLFQAGESDEGRDFAARHAEAIFSRYVDFDEALDFADDIRRRLRAEGRPESDITVFPAARIILGDSAAEAEEKARWFYDNTWPDRRVLSVLESVWGCDLSHYDVDGPLPATDPVVATQTTTHGVVNSRDQPLRTAGQWRKQAADNGWSIRQLVEHLNASIEFVGTPASVADRLSEYVRGGAIDGLNLVPNSVPGGFDEVVDHLVPALQDRGIYPTEYPGHTLRENLGLSAPVAHRRRPGLNLHTRHWGPTGDAPRALLLHGITSDGPTWWQIAEALAAAGWSVTAPDLRGHGRSPRSEDYRLGALTDDVLKVGSDWDLVVGHSLGGALTIEALDRVPTFARRAVLIDPALANDGSSTDAFLTATLALLANPDPEAYQAAHPTWHRGTVEAWVEAHRAVDPSAVRAILQQNQPWDLTERAARVRVPVHVLGADPALGAAFTDATGASLQNRNPNWTYEIVSGASHSVHRDQPGLVIERLVIAQLVAESTIDRAEDALTVATV